uniref:FXNA-like protease n=1 Tax=Bombyx mori TaxID=7091 RepID=A0A8R2M3B5_BOMMO|nr:endoplasmic reticulum metallopeptidase 1 isoform X4 [Bombyx mori]
MPMKMMKENILPQPPLSTWWLFVALAATGLSLYGVSLIDYALPEPLTRAAPVEKFIADIAYEHLVNLTSIGPRVAGSYENEVLAINILVGAVKQIAREASPHNRVELDLQVASGAFSLTFLDGMTNVYHGVQNVVVRVSGAGGRPRGRRRTAILLNCHFDTVPDSPGASDDGAGCAVLLEVMRALAATPHPLRHDVIFLLNGAEENILQASHGFITQHKWAKSVRAFINIEACGAGGREVLFQAGPDDPWIMEVYAAAVPHPFASSLAQELFQSGLIPADTDFRIFRDFGKLSGVDLAWSSNGYVYHTGLDTADNIPKSALQRTGDNVLALTRGMLSSENLEKEVDKSGQLVYFDVLGAVVISGRAPLAALAVLATIALLLLKIHVNATRAKKALYTRRGWWWRGVGRAAAAQCAAACGGVAASCAVAAALCVLRRRLAFYSRAWLLAPLYALPALAVSWWVLLRLQPREGALVRGWWRGRLQHDAGAALWGALLLLCAACGLRSAFLPLLWTLLPTLADLVPLDPRHAGGRGAVRAGGVGRRGAPVQRGAAAARDAVPHAALGARGRARPGAAPGLLAPGPRRQLALVPPTCRSSVARRPWVSAAGGCTAARPTTCPCCRSSPRRTACPPPRRPAPPRALTSPPPRSTPPRTPSRSTSRVRAAASVSAFNSHAITDPPDPLTMLLGPAHIVIIASPVEGARISWTNVVPELQESTPWGSRRTYFIALHRAREPAPWHLQLHIQHNFKTPPSHWLDLSIAGHSMFGDQKLHPDHERLLKSLPPWVAATGWGVDLHLYTV